MILNIFPIPAFKDNYIWTWFDAVSNLAWVVDPGVAKPVIDTLEKHKKNLGGILITHHHNDHTGGVRELVNQWKNIPVLGSAHSVIPEITQHLHENDEIQCGTHGFKILEIPGHTLDHIAFYNDEILFCGDTLFSAGCGRVFEGTPAQMHHSLTKLTALADTIEVYCGHEYTLANLQFAQQVEPHNAYIELKIKESIQRQAAKQPTLPSTLKQEKQFNPFLRCNESNVKQSAEKYAKHTLPTVVDVFATLRAWKNSI